ncbi:DUF1294 domain-containing protein [Paenibacillus sp. 1P07SE]|uniref:DUF1294 domain-containing protein n=1 Tax=Paenibacillus sp. 1P07SE TaxID=3132209 RepID=UPI0039A76537
MAGWHAVPLLPFVLGWLILLSLAGFAVMGHDKRLAKRSGSRRVPERRLFLLALAGGAAGMWLAMRSFRHKTRHRTFTTGMPLLTFVHTAVIVFLMMR